MSELSDEYSRLLYEKPLVPKLPPLMGAERILEQDEDYQYLKYMYPQVTHYIMEFIEDECDKMEYHGSPMFDDYPDRTTFHILAKTIYDNCTKKDPDRFPENNSLLRDLVEILLYHEILYRRNRYRNRKRLYF